MYSADQILWLYRYLKSYTGISDKERLFTIGRIDKQSEGLILLTNNGDIVNNVLRAEHKKEKEYVVTVNKKITTEFIEKMRRGVRIN